MTEALNQALVYLIAAVVSVPIARRRGLGSVLGYLIAGLAIGPFALGLVGEQEDVMHVAEFGVVMSSAKARSRHHDNARRCSRRRRVWN